MNDERGTAAEDQAGMAECFEVTELEDQDLEDASGCQSNCGCSVELSDDPS